MLQNTGEALRRAGQRLVKAALPAVVVLGSAPAVSQAKPTTLLSASAIYHREQPRFLRNNTWFTTCQGELVIPGAANTGASSGDPEPQSIDGATSYGGPGTATDPVQKRITQLIVFSRRNPDVPVRPTPNTDFAGDDYAFAGATNTLPPRLDVHTLEPGMRLNVNSDCYEFSAGADAVDLADPLLKPTFPLQLPGGASAPVPATVPRIGYEQFEQ